MDAKLAKIYYSPQGYWKGTAAIKKLADAANVPEEVAKNGSSSRLSGRSTCLRRATFLARNST